MKRVFYKVGASLHSLQWHGYSNDKNDFLKNVIFFKNKNSMEKFIPLEK